MKVSGSRRWAGPKEGLIAWKNGALPGVLASDRDSGSFLMEFVPSLNEAPAREDTSGLLDRLPFRPVQGTGPLETILKDGVTMVHGDFQAKIVLTGITGPVAIDPLPAVGDPFSERGPLDRRRIRRPRSKAFWSYSAGTLDPCRLLAWAWALTVIEFRPGPDSDDATDFIACNRGRVCAGGGVESGAPGAGQASARTRVGFILLRRLGHHWITASGERPRRGAYEK